MYYEKLALEVGATVAGLEVVKPPRIVGESGTEHRFTFVALDDTDKYAFDVYTEIKETDILRTYVKKMDTGAKTFVVCLIGRPDEKAKELARNYGIDVLTPMEVGDFFSSRITQFIRSPKAARASSR
jgi:predicted RecB family endonuclease